MTSRLVHDGFRVISRALKGIWRPRGLVPHNDMSVSEVTCYEDFSHHAEVGRAELARRHKVELALLTGEEVFTISGFCYVCRRNVEFTIDYAYGSQLNGIRRPNWRERLRCSRCGLNNRLRASIHLFGRYCAPKASDAIYITEQTTPMYRWLSQVYEDVTGSEYQGDRVDRGAIDQKGIRNESLLHLTFPDSTFDHILSFDVFEHIPDVDSALRECARCLKPGGKLLFSVPFIASNRDTVTRAKLLPEGEIQHILPPEYHGDPLTKSGCLCFYHFGWDLLQRVREAGFGSARALLYWSRDFGYLGGEQILFLAVK